MNTDFKILNKISANSNPTTHKKDRIPQPRLIPSSQGWFNICRLVNVIHHINKRKGKDHLIISTDAEKALDKNSTAIHAKNSYGSGYRGNISQHNKSYLWQKWSESHSVMSNSLRPYGLYSPWNSPGQNTGVGSLSLLQGSSQLRDQTQVSHIVGGLFTSWATRETKSMTNTSP